MKPKLYGILLVVVLAVVGMRLFSSASQVGASSPRASVAAGPYAVYLPLVMRSSEITNTALIIDHTMTDASLIPTAFITAAKTTFRLSYGHTSHGSQLISGMSVLAKPPYNYNTNGAIQSGILSLADYMPSGDLGNPDRTSWATRTRTYLNGTGSNRNVVMWSWCGQVSSATEADITTYLNLMNQLEVDYPSVKFVYMTGHLASDAGSRANTHARNDQIRNYVRANNKILFDFADIESYDPAGVYYPNGSDACEWCTTWCADPAHATECNLAATMSGCAHSHDFNCYRKGQAFWWMMARFAGWGGLP
ncbi:MAG: hypothetical protein HZB51_27700 [Chloroflexi bacterium]|nr:hypothetical protein [Chloroflexota bacterium]